jgi:hypothetical protein
MHERIRLSRSRACENEQGPQVLQIGTNVMLNRFPLSGVKRCERVGGCGW